MLAEALEANRQLSELADGLIEDNALLREQVARLAERDAERDAELEKLRADVAVLQRMLFGRSSEKSRPGPPAGGDGNAAGGGPDRERRGAAGNRRGPGARAGRRDYSRLPRLEVLWDFPDGGYCCPECGEPFTPLGDHLSGSSWTGR
jgi:transposase